MTELDTHRLKEIITHSEVLYSKETITNALKSIATEINQDYKGMQPLFLCAVNGAVIAMGEFFPMLTIDCQMDTVNVSRFHGETTGESDLTWYAKPRESLSHRDIILFDDILDAGITLTCLKQYCLDQGAKTVKSAVLIDRVQERPEDIIQAPDYVGIALEKPEFLVGYGLDYQGYFRNLPEIRRLTKLP